MATRNLKQVMNAVADASLVTIAPLEAQAQLKWSVVDLTSFVQNEVPFQDM
jgi:hypothetical protein